ncbi:MAG: extracellular solute-binding protein [Armatimonadota bacterium]|nr:extracellular solute-binding protein [Armatimonadota bacterium]
MRHRFERVTRRRFLKDTARAASALALSAWGLEAGRKASDAQELTFPVERGASLRVLRWSQFVTTDRPIFEENAARFTQRTGVPVRVEYETWTDVQPKAAAAANVGSGPDIVIGFFDEPHLWADKLVPVTDLAQYLGRKYGGWFDVCPQYGYSPQRNAWIAIPIGAPGVALNYRISWVREAGFDPDPARFPKTTDEFLRLCRALKARGHPTGFALGKAVGDGNTWVHWCLWAFGGRAVAPDNRTITINSPETANALEYARALYETMIPGVAGWLDPHNNRAFLAGEVSLTNNGISIYFAAKNDFPEIARDMNHAFFPVGPVGRPTELHLFSQAYIFNYTRYTNAAKEFLRGIMEDTQYGRWINGMLGYVSHPLKAYTDLAVWRADPKHLPFRDAVARMLPHSYAGRPGPEAARALAEFVIVDMFADACTGRRSVRDAIRAAEDRLRRIYRS